MTKQLIIESKSGANNIDKSRQRTNLSNLREDIIDWQRIVDGDKNNKIISTLRSRLERNYEYHGFDKTESINFSAIQKLAQCYLNADPWLQINYCRNSTRQSIDESVQTATLVKYINDSFVNITNGKEVPFNGTLVSKKEAVSLNRKQVKARSVDAIGNVNGSKIKIFQKYSREAGSGQTHQTVETQNWLEEVSKIEDTTILFIAQLDGPEAESHIPELRALVNKYDNIFVGNTEQIIELLNDI